jgi:hypothetical protein
VIFFGVFTNFQWEKTFGGLTKIEKGEFAAIIPHQNVTVLRARRKGVDRLFQPLEVEHGPPLDSRVVNADLKEKMNGILEFIALYKRIYCIV